MRQSVSSAALWHLSSLAVDHCHMTTPPSKKGNETGSMLGGSAVSPVSLGVEETAMGEHWVVSEADPTRLVPNTTRSKEPSVLL